MNQVVPFNLWIGHGYEERDPVRLHDATIEAVVLLAAELPIVQMPRGLITCRFPIVDGPDNPQGLLVLAVRGVASLIAEGIPTLVCCNAGISRAPAIVARALALLHGDDPPARLKQLLDHHHADVSPSLWNDLCAIPDNRFGMNRAPR